MLLTETRLILVQRHLGRSLSPTQQIDMVIDGAGDEEIYASGVVTFDGIFSGEYDGFVIREGKILARGVVTAPRTQTFMTGDTLNIKLSVDVLIWGEENAA